MDDIIRTMRISSSGLRTQGQRLRVIAQNIANANSIATDPNGKPYRRKVITFRNEFDKALGLDTVRVHKVRPDMSEFGKRFEKTPNLTGTEAETAWLVNTDKAVGLFGEPQVPVKIMIDWAADWILRGGTSLGKPTHFETRNGAY